MAKSEEDLKGMMKRLRKYLDKVRILSSEKSKILVFENGKERKKKREWRWREEDIEEVKEFKYLGYVLEEWRNRETDNEKA